jgi:predicted RecB family nuclease
VQRLDGRFVYAASDLNDYLECRHLTELEALVARRALAAPEERDDQAALVRRKGEKHERRHLERLRGEFSDELVEFERSQAGVESYRRAEESTLEAMRRGKRIIYQATFFDGTFLGHADFLRRIPVPSSLGDYSYEVIDTKLALKPKGYFLVQLCNYSEHLERLQGRLPQYGYVILGSGEEQRFRLNDYMAYYRHLKKAFLAFASDVALDHIESARIYPLKVSHCEICRWDDVCKAQRRSDDHLSLVAWIRNDQIAKLNEAGIMRVGELANAGDSQRPNGMSPETFVKLRRQAALQVRARERTEPIFELLAHEPELGFALLPAPAAGDVFFDVEGDPLFEPGRGLEYLFGCWLPDDEPKFRALWGTDRRGEKQAFEQFVDFVTERRRNFPAMHVYHYANYEKSALRRLAQAHGTREEQVDDLLRAEVLVDLFTIVRQTLAISEERYGLKNLERFYQLSRQTETRKGDDSILMFERWLIDRDQRILDDIRAYNEDDCRSTYLLREWLLARRAEALAEFGTEIPWRPVKSPKDLCHTEFVEACKTCKSRRENEREEERRSDLERALLPPILPQTEQEYAMMRPESRMRYLMGVLLAYHRREERPAWWEYFDRCESVDELLEFDKAALGGLKLAEDVPPRKLNRSSVYTYSFPDQQHKMEPGDAEDPRTRRSAGTILAIDDDRNLLELKTTATLDRARQITELIPPRPFQAPEQRKALARIGTALIAGKLRDEHPATFDLLANANPRVTGMHVLQPPVVDATTVSAVVSALEDSYLFIQGPPGSGKSTIGSQVICDLLARGARVAVTSTSHNAIHNLLHKVEACMQSRGQRFAGRYKHSSTNSESPFVSRLEVPFIESLPDNEPFDSGEYQLAGGTAWLLSRKELTGAFDYLFIDEAGQVALADALAMSPCARNVVLLGDPSQLAQVSQGRQQLHADDSVLKHLLGDSHTIAEDRGVFLDVSLRLQPQICAFISDAMYDGRLHPAADTALHRVRLGDDQRSGLYFKPIAHNGNGASSEEEADYVVAQIVALRQGGTVTDSWPPDSKSVERPLQDGDIIVVTPYNMQRRLIMRKLREAGLDRIKVGTVDKFQGQEAAVVLYSMATSSGNDLPRNMGFLFERNRVNVAISRARAASVLVCSPRLLDIRCHTAEEMALVNLLCAFQERASPWNDLRAPVEAL